MNREVLPEGCLVGGRYRIMTTLGSGSSGVIYKVTDLRLRGTAALKEFFPAGKAARGEAGRVCFPGMKEEEVRGMLHAFVQEAAGLAALREVRGLPRVSDTFEDMGTAYIVMSFLGGLTLREELALRGGVLSPREAAEILLPLAETLADMHAHGYLHRDISPDNILILDSGRPCLLDLGSCEDEYVMTGGARTVNEGFSPYELYFAEGRTGPWTDVYALGAILYLCLCGTAPPSAWARREGRPLFTSAVGRGAFLMPVIEKAMAEEPSRRYPSAAAFARALREALERKRRGMTMLSTLAACAALMCLILTTGFYRPAAREGEPVPGLTGTYEIRSCLDGSLQWAISRAAGSDRGSLILWTQVWDATQRINLEEQAESGTYRISCGYGGRELYLAEKGKDTYAFSELREQEAPVFRVIAGGEDTFLLQAENTWVLGADSGDGGTDARGQLVRAAPYDSFTDSRSVRWLLQPAEERDGGGEPGR